MIFDFEDTPEIERIYSLCEKYDLPEIAYDNAMLLEQFYDFNEASFINRDFGNLQYYPTDIRNMIVAEQYNQLIVDKLYQSLADIKADEISFTLDLNNCIFNGRDCHIGHTLLLPNQDLGGDICIDFTSENTQTVFHEIASYLLNDVISCDIPEYQNWQNKTENADLSSIMREQMLYELQNNDTYELNNPHDADYWFDNIAFEYDSHPISNRKQLVMKLNHNDKTICFYSDDDLHQAVDIINELDSNSIDQFISIYKQENDNQIAYDQQHSHSNIQLRQP